jgi:two-component sensor histidine kinase/CHASE3 domain sensor protein
MTEAITVSGPTGLPAREIVRRAIAALSLLLVLAAGIAALFIVQGVDSQMRDVQHTYEVRRQARELVQALVDAETGQRGYLLTSEQAYLEPYRAAVSALDAIYRNLLELAGDNPAQKAKLGGLAESIEQKRSEMATTITLATGGRLAEAQSIIRSNAGLALMERIRGTLTDFIAEEDAKLIERNARVDASRIWLIATIIAALGGAAVLTYALFTRTERQMVSLARTQSALQSQNIELETRVAARTAELEEARAHAERERARVEALLQETNHRIGNSLATVSSMLGLQVARSTSPEVRSALEAAQRRVHSIAAGHRRLRLGDDLETTNAAEFLAAVVEDLQSTQAEGRAIRFTTDVAPVVINARDATTIGIIVGELVINALKHAFPDGRGGQIWTRLVREGEGATLIVEDDGKGMDTAQVAAEAGLGATIIEQLAGQFGGKPVYEPRPDGGTRVVVAVPGLELTPLAG